MHEDDLIPLIDRLKQGDIYAFESIYSLFHQRIYNFCLKLLPSVYDAQEAVQKVFIIVWEQKESLDSSKSFTAYIYSIARYTAYHDYKKLVYGKAVMEQMHSDSAIFAETEKDELLYKELMEEVSRIIDLLPAQRRLIFRLSRFYNLTYRTIAAKLNITENTVDTQIRRAIKFIRKQFRYQ